MLSYIPNFVNNSLSMHTNVIVKTQIRHDLPPHLSGILCSSLLFVDDLFSVCFLGRLCTSFWHCSSLDICLFTDVFYCSLSRLVSSLTFLRVFLDSLYISYFLAFWSLSLFLFILFSLKILSPQTWIITISSRWQSFSFAGIVAWRVL